VDTDTLTVWGIGLGLALAAAVPMVLRIRRREQETALAQVEALRYGLHEPVSLHPVIDTERCIGSGSCVAVCPEGVLGMRDGHAVAVSPARCIGHGLCERSCPMDAIQLVFGTEKRGVELPRVRENFETNVPGLYIVGELGGMGLVANAFEQGRQCIDGIAAESPRGPEGLLDAVIVGCGPAGLSASLTARHRGLRTVTVEKEDVGGTVRHYPRKKLVMTRPVVVPGHGKLSVREITKEQLVELWEEIALSAGLDVRTGEGVTAVRRLAPHHFRVETGGGVYETRRVVLAIGRRGVPRKLGVPGEDAPHVLYSLREPEAYQGDRVLVVGGGDSAVEAALALAEQPGNQVRIAYRGNGFARIKPANQERITDLAGRGAVEILWNSAPVAIEPDSVRLEREGGETVSIPTDQVFVMIGGELPTPFLRACGVELETHFGKPRAR
jgi:thioredoxin reductase/NAD-dependent dihydropyrimidine dehydrogenase PreA subunit